MSVLAICHKHDRPGTRDVRGAFRPAARAFSKVHGARIVEIDNGTTDRRPKPLRRRDVLAVVAQESELRLLALFCHGTRRGLQMGFDISTVDELAQAIADVARRDVRVALFACSTGGRSSDVTGGDGDFADRLRDAMSALKLSGGWVDAHTTAGHTTKNPFVRRFHTDGKVSGSSGGSWIVTPRSAPFKIWNQALKSRDGTLRYRFPVMTQLDILSEILPTKRTPKSRDPRV